VPHVVTSSGDEQSPTLPHSSSPLAHPHGPHSHESVHVWVPCVPQLCDAFGSHTPSPLHDDQSLHVPFVHVRVSVPHRPQGWLLGP